MYVFERAPGKPVNDFGIAWTNACTKAGVPGPVPHDLCRSRARALALAFISSGSGMADRAGESSFLKNLAPMADAEKGNPAPASSAGEKPEAIKADRPIASLFRMTDTGNGKLFVNQHYQNVRYMHGKKQWTSGTASSGSPIRIKRCIA